MPRDDGRNIADVLSEVLLALPDILQQSAGAKNRNLLLNLEQITGEQERKAKTKHQKFMEELAQQKAQRQQSLFEERNIPTPLSELDRAKISREEAATAKTIRETELLGQPDPEKKVDPDKATRDLIDKLVGARGAKTRTVGGKEIKVTPGKGLLGTGIFARPDTAITETPERKIPIGAQELQSFRDSLDQAFGLTPPDTTQGFNFDNIPRSTTDVLGRPVDTLKQDSAKILRDEIQRIDSILQRFQ